MPPLGTTVDTGAEHPGEACLCPPHDTRCK